MPSPNYALLDTPQASATSFYPRRHWTDTPDGAVDYAVRVADAVRLSCRFFAVGRANPTLLFFYGNGETAAGYDGIAPLYNRIGVNFCVADYRGYGASEGEPAFTAMLADARRLLEWLRDTMDALRFTGPLFVMGRSMGRHAAFELATADYAAADTSAANTASRISGVIIESGRPSLARFTQFLPPDTAQILADVYHAKVLSINIPTLVIHGQWDETALLPDAIAMFNGIRAADKYLEIIPGAGHNDLMYVGYRQYFAAIRRFMAQHGGGDNGSVRR